MKTKEIDKIVSKVLDALGEKFKSEVENIVNDIIDKDNPIDSWCVKVTEDNRDVVKKWMDDDIAFAYGTDSYYGITVKGEKWGVNSSEPFDKVLSTDDFYAKIGHKPILTLDDMVEGEIYYCKTTHKRNNEWLFSYVKDGELLTSSDCGICLIDDYRYNYLSGVANNDAITELRKATSDEVIKFDKVFPPKPKKEDVLGLVVGNSRLYICLDGDTQKILGFISYDGNCHFLDSSNKHKNWEQWKESGFKVNSSIVEWKGGIYFLRKNRCLDRSDIDDGLIYNFKYRRGYNCEDNNIQRYSDGMVKLF
jgi:hypothetical protein